LTKLPISMMVANRCQMLGAYSTYEYVTVIHFYCDPHIGCSQ
jgi:hypothetical protein